MADSDTVAAPPAVSKPVIFKRRGPNPNIRKRAATPPEDSDYSEYSSEDEQGQRVKRRKKVGGVAATSKVSSRIAGEDLQASKFDADRSKTLDTSNDATKQSNWYDEKPEVTLDAKTLLGSTRQKPVEEPEANDGTYKGASNYKSFIQRNANAPDRKFGPMKAATNIRTITVTDYAPDVCKDYKQTGFCGFGDSCKFLHARDDYKQGWAIDQEWEAKTKGKKLEGTIVASANKADLRKEEDEEDEADAAMLEKIPFACIICKKPYTNPIATQCGHYFCEACALQRYRKKPDCAACGEGTNGVFNSAKLLNKLLERKKAREERLKAKAEKEKEEEES